MYNYLYDYDWISSGWGAASGIILFGILVAIAAGLVIYIFSALGVMNIARKNNLNYPWLAWLPIGRDYLIGKLGFELYADEGKKNPTLTWVLFGLAIGMYVFGDSSVDGLISLGFIVLETMAFYNIFKKVSDKEVVFTVSTALSGGSLGGIFLYALKDKVVPATNVKEADIVEEEDLKEDKKTTKKEANTKFCGACGSKEAKDTKFCSNCGKEL